MTTVSATRQPLTERLDVTPGDLIIWDNFSGFGRLLVHTVTETHVHGFAVAPGSQTVVYPEVELTQTRESVREIVSHRFIHTGFGAGVL